MDEWEEFVEKMRVVAEHKKKKLDEEKALKDKEYAERAARMRAQNEAKADELVSRGIARGVEKVKTEMAEGAAKGLRDVVALCHLTETKNEATDYKETPGKKRSLGNVYEQIRQGLVETLGNVPGLQIEINDPSSGAYGEPDGLLVKVKF